MRILDFKNNALFLACFRERFRPVQMYCFSGMVAAIFVMAYLSISVEHPDIINRMKYFFYVIVAVQFLVLNVQGTLFAWSMAEREKASGTLDFHRSSPEPVWAKVAGLIFGSTWFEWCLFGVLFLVQLCFMSLNATGLKGIVLFNMSLAVSGVFFHAGVVVFALMQTGRRHASRLVFFVLLLFLPHVFIGVLQGMQSFFSYLFGVSAFGYLHPEILQKVIGFFYRLQLPFIVIQMIVQLPLLALFLNGIRRIFCMPNSPVWSKQDILRFCAFVFFLITGFFIARMVRIELYGFGVLGFSSGKYGVVYSLGDFFVRELVSFLSVFVVGGIVAALFFVPSYFKFSKHVVLRRNKNIPGSGIWGDGFSSYPALLVYCVSAAVFFCFHLVFLGVLSRDAVFLFILMVSYLVGFYGFLEFFRLSRFRAKKIFFLSGLALWWGFIPWGAALTVDFFGNHPSVMTALSPFSGILYSAEVLRKGVLGASGEAQWQVLVLPWIAAGIFVFLSWAERKRVRELIEKVI